MLRGAFVLTHRRYTRGHEIAQINARPFSSWLFNIDFTVRSLWPCDCGMCSGQGVCVSPQRIPTPRANRDSVSSDAAITASIWDTSSKNAKWAALTRHSWLSEHSWCLALPLTFILSFIHSHMHLCADDQGTTWLTWAHSDVAVCDVSRTSVLVAQWVVSWEWTDWLLAQLESLNPVWLKPILFCNQVGLILRIIWSPSRSSSVLS